MRAPALLTAAVIPALLLVAPTAADAATACAAPSLTSTTPVVWGPDTLGTTHVDGVLTNVGAAATGVQVRYSYVSDAGAVLRSETTYPTLETLGHGESVGWDGPVTAPAPTVAGHWRVDRVDAVPAASTLSHAFSTTITSSTHQTATSPGSIVGTARNDSADPALWVEVAAVLRDASGAVVAVTANQTQDFLGTRVLAPGASAGWMLRLDDATPAWTTATLIAEGSEPTALPACAATVAASAPVAKGTSARPQLSTLGHIATLDAPAVAPSAPLPDERPAVVAHGAAYVPAVAAAATVSTHPAGSSAALWLELIGAALVLALGGFALAILSSRRTAED